MIVSHQASDGRTYVYSARTVVLVPAEGETTHGDDRKPPASVIVQTNDQTLSISGGRVLVLSESANGKIGTYDLGEPETADDA